MIHDLKFGDEVGFEDEYDQGVLHGCYTVTEVMNHIIFTLGAQALAKFL